MKRKVVKLPWPPGSVVSPKSLKAVRVRPYVKRLTRLFLTVHVWPAAMPTGWFQIVSGSVSGKHGTVSEQSVAKKLPFVNRFTYGLTRTAFSDVGDRTLPG